jgi:hypothetical protein
MTANERYNYDLGVQAGIALERERIIQLLTAKDSTCSVWAAEILKEEK